MQGSSTLERQCGRASPSPGAAARGAASGERCADAGAPGRPLASRAQTRSGLPGLLLLSQYPYLLLFLSATEIPIGSLKNNWLPSCIFSPS